MPASLIALPSTACFVTLANAKFEDVNYVPTQDTIAMEIRIQFNGTADELVDRVVFPRNATLSVKTTAVKNRVNEILASYEPATPALNNANIQISGMPT